TYAANGGYIKGYGDGNFGPSDKVTGVQVLAIMLRAIGYGQKGEYEGAGWKDNVLTDAQSLGLLKGVANISNLDKPAARELVAQLLFNAITEANIVYYTPALGYYTGDVLTGLAAQTLGKKVFGLTSAESYIVGNQATGEDYTILGYNANGKAYTAADAAANKSFVLDTALTQFGHQYKIWYNAKASATNIDGAYTTIYATFDKAENSAITSTDYAKLTAAAKKAYVAYSAYHDDFATTVTPDAYNIVVNNADGTKALIGLWLTIDQYTAINNYAATKTASFTKLGTVNQAKIDGLSALTLGDYINVVKVTGTAGAPTTGAAAYPHYNVSVLGITQGTVSYVDASTGAITLNGSVVGKSYLAGWAANNPLTIPATWNFSATYTVYTDLLGNYVGAYAANTASYLKATYAYYIHDNAAGSIKYYLQGVDATGATQTIQLKDAAEYGKMAAIPHVDYTTGTIVNTSAAPVNVVVTPATGRYAGTYTVTHYTAASCCANEAAVATEAGKLYLDTATTVKTSTVSITSGQNYFFTADTKFIFVKGYGDGLTVTVKTGLADLIGQNASYTLPVGAVVTSHRIYNANIGTTNYAIDSIIIGGAYAPTATSNVVYFAKTSASTVYKDGTLAPIGTNELGDVYVGYINGVATQVVRSTADSIQANKFYSYTIDSQGRYVLNPLESNPNTTYRTAFGQVTHAAGTSTDYVVVGSTQYKITGATVVNVSGITNNPNMPATTADVVTAAENNTLYAAVQYDKDNNLTYIYITYLA
ncbi:MAG: hypothetical protein ACI4O5_01505, partial [Oscillospiraceae bacterium]